MGALNSICYLVSQFVHCMNINRKLELIESLKEEVGGIIYGSNGAKKIVIKAEMIIRQVFGEKSRYMELLNRVDFLPMYVFDTTSEAEYKRSFEEGKSELLNLCDVMFEELTIQLKLEGSKKEIDKSEILTEEKTEKEIIVKKNENKKEAIKKSKFDRLVHRVKDHPIISIVVFVCFCAYVAWAFVSGTLIPFYKWYSDKEEKVTIIEYSVLDYLKSSYEPAILRKNGFVRGSVSRRDDQCCYFVPSSWDKDEPLDGPAGNRYQSYFLPSDPRCKIIASADIECLKDILPDDTVFHICSLEKFLDERKSYLDTSLTNFTIISITPLNRFYFESDEPYEIEGRKLFYSHNKQGTEYKVIEQLVYSNDIGFILSFETPASEYSKYSDIFTEVASKSFFKDLMIDLNF